MWKPILSFAALLTSVLAISRTSSPPGCITVGSGAKFTSIQEAVQSLSKSSTQPQCIFIEPGEYKEQVFVTARAAQLSFYGYTTDTLSYSANVVNITNNLYHDTSPGMSNDATATLRVKAKNFKAYNINVINTYGKGAQALALSAYNDSGYYGCQFKGFQDTVLAQKGYQVYARSYIEGATDFVFGEYTPAWFEKVDLRVLENNVGYVTANGRNPASPTSYYVFNNCTVDAAPNNNIKAGTYYLGRPWSNLARVVFQHTNMTDVINTAGWRVWQPTDKRTENVEFGEYENVGAGASTTTRADFAQILSSSVSIDKILGSNYDSAPYYDKTYM